jgi:hypothetical protein
MSASFIRHDSLDAGANNPNDVDVRPTAEIRHEKDHCFTLIQLKLPSDLTIEDAPSLLFEEMVLEWLIVPDHMEQFIEEVPGTKHRCGYRISKSLNEQKWNFDSWPLEYRPQEGDWLFCGPGDKTDPDHTTDAFVPMDELSLSAIFLEGSNLSGEIFYVARSVQKIPQDGLFFKYMLEKGPVIYTHHVDGVSIFCNQNYAAKQEESKEDQQNHTKKKHKKSPTALSQKKPGLTIHHDTANDKPQAYIMKSLSDRPHYYFGKES